MQSRRSSLTLLAWSLMLLVSDLPDILWDRLVGQPPASLFWAKVVVLAVFSVLAATSRRVRPLLPFGLILVVFFLALGGSTWLGDRAWWQERFGGAEVSFTVGYLGFHVRDVGVALVVVAALWIVKRRRHDFFLALGRLDAPIRPVRWLGIREGESWRTFGWIFAAVAGVGVSIPVALALRPAADSIVSALPLLPIVLLLAAVNAFSEEVYYRASLLATLHEVIGSRQALLITATFFGLAHYLYGSPPGIIGVLMTGFLAWLLGKSMLETRGMFWAWVIHFVPDVVIFASYAVQWQGR